MAAWWNRKKTSAEAKPEPTEKKNAAKPTTSRPKRRAVPLEVKILAMEACESGLERGEVANLAGVSKTTIDNWCRAWREGGAQGLARRPASKTTRKVCDALTERIVEHRQEHPEHGVRRIRDELRRNEALDVSAETVRRVVNDAGLGNPAPKSKRRPPQVRRFERAVPNAMWQIDIFSFQLKRHYPVYLVGIIDDHSRYIVGHGLFRRQTADAVMEVVKGAIGQWGAPRELLSDNGRQFVAWRGKTKFQKTLKRQGIQHVRSAPHHPMTLGKIERFWKTIWTEYLEDAVFASFADACQRIEHWVGYYNHQRPHQGIGGASPADRFYGIAGDVEEATRQGCADNALRLALGQVPEPPLYLLGKLGETDVRVARKGNAVEVRLGDQVHEVIRLSGAMTVAEDGSMQREEASDEVEGAERTGATRGGGDGPVVQGADQGDLRDVRGVPADALPRNEEDRRGIGRSAGAETARPQGAFRGGPEGVRTGNREGGDAEGAGGLEDEVRGGAGVSRAAAEVRPWGAGEVAPFKAEKNGSAGDRRAQTPESTTQEGREVGDEPGPYAPHFSPWVDDDDGDWT